MKRYDYACWLDENDNVVWSETASYELFTFKRSDSSEWVLQFEVDENEKYIQLWTWYFSPAKYGLSIKVEESEENW